MLFSRILLSIYAAASVVLGAPLAPILKVASGTIADNFIVVMKPMSNEEFLTFLAARPPSLVSATKSIYNIGSFKGFHGVYSATLLNTITALTQVKYIEPDTVVKVAALTTQANAPWGLARISHKDLGSTDYIYDDSAGAGTFSYIIDTGCLTEHVEFEGRAIFGANFVDTDNTDGNGHGTHVSGTVGSRAYGVAKKTTLVCVKVLSAAGSGSSSGVMMGVQFAVDDAKSRGKFGKAVANLSLGGFGVPLVSSNEAIVAAVAEGLFVAVAAGNDGRPSFLTTPANEPTACTVGATDKTDKLASYSNYGAGVDILAPGTDILSTWIRSTTDTNIISGTSMATPHVVGLAAYLLGLEGDMAPGPLCERIRTLSTKGKIAVGALPTVFGQKNELAYNGNGA